MRFGSCRGASSNSSWIEPSDHNSNPQASRYGATKMLLLDAKYRDLWEHELPREMLYQLALYALSQKPVGRSTILYPTMAPKAADAVINVSEPSSGSRRAEVVLRPVDLNRLSDLLGMQPGIGKAKSCRSLAEDLIADSSTNVTPVAASISS